MIFVALMLVLAAQSGGAHSIGVATQRPDGTIVLQLGIDEPGARGDSLLVYRPDHPDYERVLKHVGPIPKNGSVPVKPFPERW